MYISSRRIFKGVATLSHRRKDSSSHSIKSALLRLVWAVQINQGHPVPPGSCVKVSHLTALKLANNKGLVGKRQYGACRRLVAASWLSFALAQRCCASTTCQDVQLAIQLFFREENTPGLLKPELVSKCLTKSVNRGNNVPFLSMVPDLVVEGLSCHAKDFWNLAWALKESDEKLRCSFCPSKCSVTCDIFLDS